MDALQILNNSYFWFHKKRKNELLKSDGQKSAKELIGLPGNVTEDDIGLGMKK